MLDKVMKIIVEKGIEDIDLVNVLARELAGMKPIDKQNGSNFSDKATGSTPVSSESM